LGLAWRTLRLKLVHPASNKIEFSHLNGNLMVPDIHPLTLTFNRNSHKGEPPTNPTLPEEESQCACQEQE
jgi:hypothetical protein